MWEATNVASVASRRASSISAAASHRRVLSNARARSIARAAVEAGLAACGYDCPQTGTLDEATRIVLTAFQRRFRPGRIDGLPDAGCAAMLDRLLALRP